ncbi:glycosyltransferase family 4 protein [Acetobacter fallax]|uniref:Glycosyltransferase n=1 Tax=Acetobacter fallax TaxID=1737473 RepID=A0ABX0KFG0_9PROT|nr:glycosyltransferase family 4 protein [Acetobacter fallax]NHO33150.1 glycosyltransferase [Acetobacter fallax]NHO36829.1 glycosyltransferase [Acetobacter fallax]
MRIAYVINSLEGGGAAFPVPSITRVFREAGHDVAIFALTRRDGLAEPPMRAAGLDVFTCQASPHDHLDAFRWLMQTLKAWQPTHLWTSLTRATIFGQLAGRRLRVPVASWQHSARLKPGNRLLLRMTRNLSCLWIGDSRYVTEITRQSLSIPPSRLACWPIFCAKASTARATPWTQGEPLRLGSLGRLHPVKGYAELLQALALLKTADLPRFELIIAGEGQERSRLETLITQHGLSDRVHLPGFTAHTEQFLTSLHLYLQPSRWEGFCIAAHEAMLAGLPVIGSRVGEMTYSIENGVTGWHVPPRNPEALASALHHALSRPDALAEMGTSARNLVLSRYGEETFRQTGFSLLERLEQSSPA